MLRWNRLKPVPQSLRSELQSEIKTGTEMNPNPLSYLHDQLADLEAKGLHFRLRVLEGEQKPVAHFDGKDVINLSSNNYLGLTTHKALRRAAIEAIRTHGVGAGRGPTF